MTTIATFEIVRKTLDERIAELQEELDSLTKLRDYTNAMSGNGKTNGAVKAAPFPAPIGDNARPGRTMAKVRKRPLADKVLTMIQGHPEGVPINEIAEQCSTASSYVYAVARKLIEEGKVERRKGRIFPKS